MYVELRTTHPVVRKGRGSWVTNLRTRASFYCPSLIISWIHFITLFITLLQLDVFGPCDVWRLEEDWARWPLPTSLRLWFITASRYICNNAWAKLVKLRVFNLLKPYLVWLNPAFSPTLTHLPQLEVRSALFPTFPLPSLKEEHFHHLAIANRLLPSSSAVMHACK